MKIFFKTCFFTFTIWITAAFINGLLYALVFTLGNMVRHDFAESVGLAFIFSAFFSTPAAFCFWLVFVTNSGKENLSKLLLQAVFVLSTCSCVFIRFLPDDVYEGHGFLLAVIIVVSSVSAVLLHHRFLRSFYQPQSPAHV